RLQRGIRALRRVLTNELIRDAAAYGLADVEADGWQETKIWCTGCGDVRLIGRFLGTDRALWLRCPGCRAKYPDSEYHQGGPTAQYRVKGFKAVLKRAMADGHEFWKDGVRGLVAE